MATVKKQLKDRKITIVALAKSLDLSRVTVYKRFRDKKWSKLEIAYLKQLGVSI